MSSNDSVSHASPAWPTRTEHGREVIDAAAIEERRLQPMLRVEIAGQVFNFTIQPSALDAEPTHSLDYLAENYMRDEAAATLELWRRRPEEPPAPPGCPADGCEETALHWYMRDGRRACAAHGDAPF